MKLLLLPGMHGTGDLFGPLLSALSKSIEPIVVTYPAFEPLGYGDLTDIARSAVPVDEPYAILGESFSGPIAVSLAANPGSNLAALILCCTFVRNPSPALAAIRPILPFIPIRNLLADSAIKYLLGAQSVDLNESLLTSLHNVRPDVFRKRIREVIDVDVSHLLERVTVPIQYLQATNDRVVSKAAAQLICSIAASTELCLVDGPHLLLQTAPRQVAMEIARFLGQPER